MGETKLLSCNENDLEIEKRLRIAQKLLMLLKKSVELTSWQLKSTYLVLFVGIYIKETMIGRVL